MNMLYGDTKKNRHITFKGTQLYFGKSVCRE